MALARPLLDRPEQIRLIFHKPANGQSPLVLVNPATGQAAGLQPGDGKEKLNAEGAGADVGAGMSIPAHIEALAPNHGEAEFGMLAHWSGGWRDGLADSEEQHRYTGLALRLAAVGAGMGNSLL